MYTDPQSDFQLVRSQIGGFTSAAQLTLRYVALSYLSKQTKVHELARAYSLLQGKLGAWVATAFSSG